MVHKNILVIGGTHGNERTGIQVVRRLARLRFPGIKFVIANEVAVRKNVRCVETDLNRSTGRIFPISYEEQRATYLAKLIRAAQVVVEFHNTPAVSGTCGIVTMPPSKFHYAMAAHFGMRRIVIMPAAGSLSGLAPRKFFSLEISTRDIRLRRPDFLCDRIAGLSKRRLEKVRKVPVYRFTGTTVMATTLARLGLSRSAFKNFKPISKRLCRQLGISSRKVLAPIFVGGYDKSSGFLLVERLKVA